MGVYAAKECNRSIWAVVTDTRFGEIVPERQSQKIGCRVVQTSHALEASHVRWGMHWIWTTRSLGTGWLALSDVIQSFTQECGS